MRGWTMASESDCLNYAARVRKCMLQNIKSGQDGPVDSVRHLLNNFNVKNKKDFELFVKGFSIH